MALKRTRTPFYSKAERVHRDVAARASMAGQPELAATARHKAERIRDGRIAAHARRMAAMGKGMAGRPLTWGARA